MTDTDIEQIEKFIQHITEKIVEDRIDADDVRNMINTISSLNAEIIELRQSQIAKIKLISDMARAQ